MEYISVYRRKFLRDLILQKIEDGKTALGRSGAGTFLGDAGDFADILEELNKGNKDQARRLARNLDTAPREEIPWALWNYLGFKPLHESDKGKLAKIEEECLKEEKKPGNF